ncbi:hypothetical protein SV13_03245 [Clostridium perfringens]|nr:hypothetical protein SV13_03245 [Clostridium perfringens]MDM0980764.1 hypothetical protein [Clostridium perfringens]HBI7026671.1 hypothetical protein [Clostridium perfringens]HBI7034786.1 hypothetical protein [Clostridium perfringens]HBI7048879.1 hypothetical protein [Clostridium perfringens]
MCLTTQNKRGEDMNKKKLEQLIPKLELIKNQDDLELIQKAIDSCLTVQMLKDISRKKVI